jgi:hypothetical protein
MRFASLTARRVGPVGTVKQRAPGWSAVSFDVLDPEAARVP